ncbi:uroporphyrin-III C-methyltransferase [Oryzisolibacter propanilivorax]|uniref:uroporphyrinogen-III C-methyltransferase n=1 Tax=Oryzisolibacter propanilivorax TaxID=1527607 RepID=A0A1G9PCI5_9BURK|nr:uroporphyrinogen-III C-methyltransferase [Oryzisolibacter propanilivorax]SDL96201.1 uroporphyrin-III C-methyltransferase [Oryzisolibacter propanilivorax]
MSFVEEARWFQAPPAQDPSAPVAPGHVTLVGAGPGDPELLTVRALRALQGARMVLYDHLVSREVLQYVDPAAELVYVGKQSSQHTLPQESIIDLMLRLARSGRSLVRLKGGDCFIFGRGGEEVLALAEHGIPYDVVPGITAAQAAGACAGIALTHREHAGTLVLATGHLCGRDEVALDWQALARPRQTLVIYMGIATLALICRELQAHGLPGGTPAALVERASLAQQRCVTGTLAGLPALAQQHDVRAPALIVIGEVVALQPQILRGMAVPAQAG